VVFEGATVNSKVDHYVSHFCDAESANPRVQMDSHGVGATYTLQHQEHLRNIIEGYDVCIGDDEPITFDHKVPKNKPAKRKTNNSIVWRQTPKIRGQVSYWRLPQDPEIGHKCTCVRLYFLSFFEYPVVSFSGSYKEKKTRLTIMFLWF
jgi:hypothetical protein